MSPNSQPISDQTWARIRTEFTLPALEQVRRRLWELMEDPEPVMQQLVRVFIDDGTFCPGFQFRPGGQLHPAVVEPVDPVLKSLLGSEKCLISQPEPTVSNA